MKALRKWIKNEINKKTKCKENRNEKIEKTNFNEKQNKNSFETNVMCNLVVLG